MLNKSSFIFVTGHRGLVGSSLLRRLKFYGYKNIIVKSKKELDLRNQNQVSNFKIRIIYDHKYFKEYLY